MGHEASDNSSSFLETSSVPLYVALWVVHHWVFASLCWGIFRHGQEDGKDISQHKEKILKMSIFGTVLNGGVLGW